MHLYTKCNKISSLQTTTSTENPEISESNPQAYQTVGITSQNITKDLYPRNSQDIYHSSNKPIDWLQLQYKLSKKLNTQQPTTSHLPRHPLYNSSQEIGISRITSVSVRKKLNQNLT